MYSMYILYNKYIHIHACVYVKLCRYVCTYRHMYVCTMNFTSIWKYSFLHDDINLNCSNMHTSSCKLATVSKASEILGVHIHLQNCYIVQKWLCWILQMAGNSLMFSRRSFPQCFSYDIYNWIIKYLIKISYHKH